MFSSQLLQSTDVAETLVLLVGSVFDGVVY